MADLAGSKIQIMNGAGTNLFPRNRTIDIVDKAGNAVFDATTQQVKAAYLPSYVDDVLEVQYLGSGTLPTFASASHANKWMFSTSNNKMYSGSTTAWVQKDWETGKIYIDVADDKVEGTYRWTGAKPVKITEAPIATTDDVRPWTTPGTAEDTFVPNEMAVAAAINAGVTSAVSKAKSDIGKVVNTITANNPVGRNVASGNVTLSLNYGTTLSNGVALKLDNTTSLIAYAQTANGVSTTIGTVATLPTALASTNDLSTVFGLSGHASTIASANTYVVPTFKLFVDVTSKINTLYGKAVSTITGDANGNKTGTYTTVDGNTGTFKYTDTTYGAANGAGAANKVVGTSQLAASLDTATLFGLHTAVSGKAGTSTYIVPTLGTLSMVTSALTSRINKAVADKAIGVAWLSGTGIAKVYSSGTTTEAQTGKLVVSVTSVYADAAGNAISTFTKPTGANATINFTRYDGTTGTLSYVNTNTTYGAATTASQGLVKLTDTSAALQYGATGTTVLTQAELNRSIKTYLVTSIFATSADAVAGITNSMKVDHPNEYVAANTGEIYQVISTGTNTVSAKLIVGAGDQHLLIKTDNNSVSGGNVRLHAFVTNADSAGEAGDAALLGGKTANQLLVSSAAVAGNAGTATNANSLGGTAAGTIKKAFSSVTQTGTSMVFKALDGTLTSHEVTSAVYAKTAGGVTWGNVTGKPNIVNTVTNGTVGIVVNPTSGDVKVSGVVFKKPSATSNGQMGMVPGPTSNIAIASAYLRADGTWAVPPNSTYTIPTAATVAETSAGTITNKFVTPSAYAGVKANGDAVIAGTDTMRWIAPATLQSKLVHSVTYTGLTHVNALASPNDTVKATSKYIPSEYAILNNCLFYSTLA